MEYSSQASEKAFLGCIVLDPELVTRIHEFKMDVSYMTEPKHSHLFSVMLQADNDGIDFDTVWLADKGIEWDLLNELTDIVVSTQNFQQYAYHVCLNKLQDKLQNQLKSDPEDLTALQGQIDSFNDAFTGSNILSLQEVAKIACERIIEEGQSIEIALPWQTLNVLLAGLRRQKLTFIGGRPSHHKTGMAINMASTALDQGYNVLYCDYELGEEETLCRFVGVNQGVSSRELMTKTNNWGDMLKQDVRDRLARLTYEFGKKHNDKLTISCHPKFHEIKSLAKAMKADVIVIDHIQIFAGSQAMRKGDSKASHVSDLCHKLKHLARELDVAIVCPSQIDRHAGAPPSKAQFKDSGGIEESADVLIGVWWPHAEGNTVDSQGNPCDMNTYEINIAKNRGGQVGKFKLFVNPETAQITERKQPEQTWANQL